MKLTPLDIHHKEFRHSIRGYSEEEVDAFLDEVADEFERLFKENIDLSERLEAANAAVRQFQEQEQTIRNTMISAQRSAEDIVSKSREEASTLLRDAEVKAKEIIHNALTQKQKVQNELVRIKQAEEEFRGKFKQMLEGHIAGVAEISLPDDVHVLMGETDAGMVGEVEVAASDAVAAVEAQAAVVSAPPVPEVPVAEPSQPEAEIPVEPPSSGFVQGVVLGETETPDVEAGEPELIEPKEFDFGQFDSFGEREDDIDIEEID